MRHYEILIMVHPDQSEQAAAMAERYKSTVEAAGGVVHRVEDCGRRQLAYPINEIHKAHYVLINIECDAATLQELESAFRFNDAVLRKLVVRKDKAETGPSPLFKTPDDDKKPETRSDSDDDSSDDDDDSVDDTDDDFDDEEAADEAVEEK